MKPPLSLISPSPPPFMGARDLLRSLSFKPPIPPPFFRIQNKRRPELPVHFCRLVASFAGNFTGLLHYVITNLTLHCSKYPRAGSSDHVSSTNLFLIFRCITKTLMTYRRFAEKKQPPPLLSPPPPP